MKDKGKHLVVALTVSTMLIVFNIIAVSQGTAQEYYNLIEQFMFDIPPST